MGGEFSGKTAWITGASGTLGAAVAKTLAASGASVVLSGRNVEKLNTVSRRIASESKGETAVRAIDIGSRDDIDDAAKWIIQQYGQIDILVNSTSAPIFGDFFALGDQEWEQVIQAKFLGYVRTLRAVLPYMVHRQFGRVVNITGRGGRQPTPAHLPGSSVNAAINLLTKGLANIYGRYNVRINSVAPGPITSPRFEKIRAETDAVQNSGTSAVTKALTDTPLGRLGNPSEVAEAVAYLVSERSTYTTGITFPVDGGGTLAL